MRIIPRFQVGRKGRRGRVVGVYRRVRRGGCGRLDSGGRNALPNRSTSARPLSVSLAEYQPLALGSCCGCLPTCAPRWMRKAGLGWRRLTKGTGWLGRLFPALLDRMRGVGTRRGTRSHQAPLTAALALRIFGSLARATSSTTMDHQSTYHQRNALRSRVWRKSSDSARRFSGDKSTGGPSL
jgi:hypothetical protein